MATTSAKPWNDLPPKFSVVPDGSHAVLSVPIEKAAIDWRSYRLIRLPNHLEALLISDPKTDKSSSALDVYVGHLSDPDNLQGLAHFCEHLLFMGTEKYPKENDYGEYLNSHNGHSNAYTGLENTNYYFEVGHEFLEGAMDRFAQFFISPLFDASCKDREINAVDSEHKKNLQDDGWRLYQLEKASCDPKHAYAKFGSGSSETLRDWPLKEGIDVREELIKFHSQYYSANLMKLVVLGREPLDQLTQWVVEKFSAVRNKNLAVPTFGGNPLTENELKKQISVKPVKDFRTVELTWAFPDQYPLYASQPSRYLSHLIGHEGAGSLLSLLKKKGWVNNLSAGSSHRFTGVDFFKIEIDLTENGLEHYDEVVVHVFQYIRMLKDVGAQEWLWKEVASLASIGFRFKEQSSASKYASKTSTHLQRPYPREWVLSGPYLIREYDAQRIEECLKCLDPEKFTLMLVSRSLTGLDRKERWYGTEYKVEPISDKLLETLKNVKAHPDLKFPEPNDFIPSEFDTHKCEVEKPLSRPTLIKNTPLVRLWHKKDDTFWIPKANAYFLLRSPIAYATPTHCVKTQLYAECVRDALTEYAYAPCIAGLTYDLENQHEGMMLTVGGYNHKLPVHLEKIVEAMRDLKVKPERFVLIKDQLQRWYRNALLEAPYNHAVYYVSYLTQETLWVHEEKIAALEDITADDLQRFVPELLSELHIEALIHGNVFENDALRMLQAVEDLLKPRALVPAQLMGYRSLLLPNNGRFVYQRDVPDPNDLNSSIEYYVQVDDLTNTGARARSSLLAQIASEAAFDQLRTKEQLGYVVFSGLRNQTRLVGYRVIIQSDRDTVYLENRIEAFLDKLQKLIEDMSDEDFKRNVESLIETKLEKDKNLAEESHRYWRHIRGGFYDFQQVGKDVAELRTITKPDLLQFYNKYVHYSSPQQRKISVHLRSQKPPSVNGVRRPIDHLFSCFQLSGLEGMTKEDLELAMGEHSTLEQLDGPQLEEVLKRILVDQVKADDSEMVEIMKQLSAAYLSNVNGVNGTNGNVAQTYADGRDDAKLRDYNVIVKDPQEFKCGIQLSPAPLPVVPFSDLANKP